MLVPFGRAVGVHVAHADQLIGKARWRHVGVIQRAEAEFGLDRGQRQPLLHPAEGVEPRLRFVRQLAVHRGEVALIAVAYQRNAGVGAGRIEKIDEQHAGANAGGAIGDAAPFAPLQRLLVGKPAALRRAVAKAQRQRGARQPVLPFQRIAVRRKAFRQRANLNEYRF